MTAIPKTPGSNSIYNFRPISLTPTAIKVMEMVIYGRLLSWLSKFHIIPPEQHGFLPGASTLTNLADTVYDFSRAINTGKLVDVIYVDLSKAFDKVCHQKLLTRLEMHAVQGNLLKWFQSYCLTEA